ncbi:MAG: AI-2E family transporter [Actinomycetota bacterium]
MQSQPMHPISEGIRRAGVVAWAILGILLLVGVFVGILYFVREMLPPLVLALMLIFLMSPLVNALERRGINRVLGTLTIYALVMGVVITIGVLIAPLVVDQITDLTNPEGDLRADAAKFAEDIASRVGATYTAEQFDKTVKEALDRLGGFRQVARFSAGALHGLVIFVLAPIFALYVLIDLPKFKDAFIRHLPPNYRDEWMILLERSGNAIGSFFRGQLLVASIVGVMSSVGFGVIGLQFWLPIGLLAGFFNIIPLVGPFVGGAVAVVVGAVTGGPGLAIKAAIVMVIVQQIDNHLISPNIMGRAVRLHPVSVMVALLAGGTLAGLWGMLLGVPALAVTKIVGLHYYQSRVLHRPDSEPVEQTQWPKPKGPKRRRLAKLTRSKVANDDAGDDAGDDGGEDA